MTTEDPSDEPSGDLIARSRAMRNVLTLAQRIAQSDAPVLLPGVSGVGKERIARYLHAASRRARGAYLAENCAALPGQLLECELFGHVRGAFTGAERGQRGPFRAAAGGRLLAYAWPGDVGELEQVMERAVVFVEGKPKIEAGDVPPEIAGEAAGRGADEGGSVLPLAEVERRHILHALEKMGGNRKETARVLGIGANTLWRKLRQYGPTMHRERE